jgi:hypothetical protein
VSSGHEPEIQGRHRLTERDQEILRLLAEHGCVSADRVKLQFWPSNPISRSHYRRLAILKRAGLVENVFSDRDITMGYRLTKKGREVLQLFFPQQSVSVVRRAYKTSFEHDQLLIDVQRILQKSPVVKDFETESEIRRRINPVKSGGSIWKESHAVPDALFTFQTPNQRIKVAVELELTLKSAKRYERIFRNHLLAKNWNLVFYLVKNQQLLVSLRENLDMAKREDSYVRVSKAINGIYFCELGKFLSLGLEAPFSNGKEEISLGKIAKNFGMK